VYRSLFLLIDSNLILNIFFFNCYLWISKYTSKYFSSSQISINYLVHLWFRKEALKLLQSLKRNTVLLPLSKFHTVGSGIMVAKSVELWICTFQTTRSFGVVDHMIPEKDV